MKRTDLLASTALILLSIDPLAAQNASCGEADAAFLCEQPSSAPVSSSDENASVTVGASASVISDNIDIPAIDLSGNNVTITNNGLIEQVNTEKDGHAITGGGDGVTIVNSGTIKSGDRAIEMLAGSGLKLTNEVSATIDSRREAVRADVDSPGAFVQNDGIISSTDGRALQLRSFGARVINNGNLIGGKEVVEARGGFYLENYGLIGLNDPAIEDEDGVQLAGGEVQNHGIISGSDDGIDLDEGVIMNYLGAAIRSTAPDTNNNGGIDIDEVYDDGVSNERLPTGVTIVNDGTIEGPKGINTQAAVASSLNLTNRGVLNGRGGIAVHLASGMDDSIVTIDGNSEIYGDVRFGEGDDKVQILGLTSAALSTGLFDGGLGENTVEVALPLSDIEAFRVEGDRVDMSFSFGNGPIIGSFVKFDNWLIDGQNYDSVALAEAVNNVAGLPDIATALARSAEAEQSRPTRRPADLVMVGSDNIGEDLAPLVLEQFADVIGASSVSSAIEFPDDIAQFIFTRPDASEFVLEIESTSSGPGIERLIAGTADIALSSRQAEPEEIDQIAAQGRGNLLDVSQEYIVGVDSVLMTVNKNNPIDELSREQLAAIYNNEIVNWSEVGGPDLPIVPVARDSGSARSNFETWVFGDAAELSPAVTIVDGGSDMRAIVAQEAGAIGYSISDNVGNTKPIDLILDCGVRTEATPFKSKAEEYLLGRRIRLYIDNNDSNPAVRQFTDLMISPMVDQYVEESGYFALNLIEDEQAFERLTLAALIDQPEAVGLAAQAEIAEQLDGANRLSLTCRFPTNQFTLDSKGLRDLDRLINYMSLPENADREFTFVGFADSVGEYANNARLSQNRAATVLQQARDHQGGAALADMNILTAGLSEAAPVGCNDDPQGRSRNRRVEVWVR
jgi:ABC-type phosphate transport system substrate-binding protein